MFLLIEYDCYCSNSSRDDIPVAVFATKELAEAYRMEARKDPYNDGSGYLIRELGFNPVYEKAELE
jgi:hypothetical protein